MPDDTDDTTLRLKERVCAAVSLGESHFREFKSALEGPESAKTPRPPKLIKRDIAETLVAFANADGGELLIGVEDDGTITGVPHQAPDIEVILGAATANVHSDTPLPVPLVARVELEGKTVLYLATAKSTRFVHMTSDGRCLQRRDRQTLPVPAEQIQFERQEQLSREYDRQFVDAASITSLDLTLLARAGAEIAPGMSPEKLLQLLGLADFSAQVPRLRKAALLLFAKDVRTWHPRSEVRILRIRGTELKSGKEYNVLRDDIVTGAIFELVSKSWEALRNDLVQTRLSNDGRFLESIMYPEDACREALINAIAHRDYSIEGRAVEILVFEDRMEVRSPGALLSNVRVDELKKLRGTHESRNALITRVLKELRYMREMGEGFRRIFHLMKVNELVEPELVADRESFSVILHHKSVLSESAQRLLTAYERFNLTREERKVILLGQDNVTFSMQGVLDTLDIVDTDDYRALLEGLQLKGLLVERVTKSASAAQAKQRGVGRRKIARFGIRPPTEADVFLTELFRAFQQVGMQQQVTPSMLGHVVDGLAPSNPFKTAPAILVRSLQSLGLIDSERRPIGSLRSLLESSPGLSPVGSEPSGVREARDPGANLTPMRSTTAAEPSGTINRTLFVGNLGSNMTEQEVRTLFSPYGEVALVTLPTDYYSGRTRGFAFVRMVEVTAATKAKQVLDGWVYRNRVLTVEWDQKRDDRMRRTGVRRSVSRRL
jgi:ATP-dependent DNA helicase RecG